MNKTSVVCHTSFDLLVSFSRNSSLDFDVPFQVITDFCKYVGADPKVKQQLIKLAKSNGGYVTAFMRCRTPVS